MSGFVRYDFNVFMKTLHLLDAVVISWQWDVLAS